MRLHALWWWIDRWRKSSAYMDMTLEEQGAYRNLLDEAQLRGGPLPTDERVLAKACGDALAWARVRDVVMARFTLKADGWHNETLDAVIKESDRRAAKQANYRAGRGNGTGNGTGNATGNAAGNGGGNTDGSPISHLPSPISDLREERKERAPNARAHAGRGMAPGALAGSLPRDHLYCRPPCVRVCVTQKLHGVLRERHGGSNPDDALDAFYAEVRAELDPDVPIGERAWDFWERQYRERFGGQVATGKTAGNTAAALRFIARGAS